VLLNALVWHDLGNVRGRKGHAGQVRRLFGKVSGHLYDPQLAMLISNVAEAHSGPDAIGTVIPNSLASTAFQGDEVHPQFLAAVLRFTDGLDEDHERISTRDFARLRLVKKSSQRYWFFNAVNDSISIEMVQSRIGVYEAWVEIRSWVPRSKFGQVLPTERRGTVRALVEYLRRIMKIESERRYCNPYLRKAYSHTGVEGIRVSLHIHEMNARPLAQDLIQFELSDTAPIDRLVDDPAFAEISGFLREAIGLL
jgi:hypothetical protein